MSNGGVRADLAKIVPMVRCFCSGQASPHSPGTALKAPACVGLRQPLELIRHWRRTTLARKRPLGSGHRAIALYLAPYVAELRELQTQTKIPIRARIETAFRQLISGVCGEPESGMLISRNQRREGREARRACGEISPPLS